jgi:hypothetical protein
MTGAWQAGVDNGPQPIAVNSGPNFSGGRYAKVGVGID